MEQRVLKSRFWAAAAPAVLLAGTSLAEGQVNQTFQAHRLQIEALIGNLQVDVVPGGTSISVAMTGTDEMIQKMRLSTSGDTLVIGMEGVDSDWFTEMWDWSSVDSDDLKVTISLPQGTPINVENFIGDASIGDVKSDVKFSATSGSTTIGEVTSAEFSIAGSGDIAYSRVSGKIEASIAGSGSIKGGDVGEASIEIAGGGEIKLGNVNGGLEIDVAGSGEVYAQSVNGKVDIDVAGSGDVKIDGGKADPFKVDIAGSGDVKFGGTANNPDVSVMGSGDVWIAAYTGTLTSDGADIKIGQAQ